MNPTWAPLAGLMRCWARMLISLLEKKTSLKPLFVEQASPVIALHAGKGSISLSFIQKGSGAAST
ncbi:MAG: hypothetical protein PHR69_04005 [Sphaerochaeta sp.]|nr:hypothetical protein [Sphaerochaeta sp.]